MTEGQGDIPARLAAAQASASAGRRDEAISDYARILRDAPGTLEAMLPMAGLFVAEGNLAFARSVLLEAAMRHPERADVFTLLGNALVDLDEHDAARSAYERAIAIDPNADVAHVGLAVIAERAGDTNAARRHWRRGYARGVPAGQPWRSGATRVLILSSAIGGNVPLWPVVDHPQFVRAEIFAEGFSPAIPLPHDALVVNGIGDADRCARALDRADELLASLGARSVVNAPDRVRATTRSANAQRFATLPNVHAPHARPFSRHELAGPGGAGILASAGFTFPLLLRAPGFHTGRHFERVDTPEALSEVIQRLPGDDVLAIEFADTISSDGGYRKYRVLTIDQTLYPLHLAISPAWKVHYFSAAMSDHAGYREEEAAFLRDPRAALGPASYAALERVAQALGLEYAGIDFGVDAAGRIVVFEANATMLIAPVAEDPRFAYRRPAAGAAIEATRAMLVRLAAQNS